VVSTLRPGVREVLGQVVDPEIPVLTIADLGVLREVREIDGRVEVTITPTYSGCPAMEAIRADIAAALHAAGYSDVVIRSELAPAWTTDWLTLEGRRKLAAYGIAPPTGRTAAAGPVAIELGVRCPQCDSADTRLTSRFGSTSCKSLWVCNACREPFDHFRPL
jgi:ring-1,2-phenylacetyl-CoA epoxidase subunit PaaD